VSTLQVCQLVGHYRIQRSRTQPPGEHATEADAVSMTCKQRRKGAGAQPGRRKLHWSIGIEYHTHSLREGRETLRQVRRRQHHSLMRIAMGAREVQLDDVLPGHKSQKYTHLKKSGPVSTRPANSFSCHGDFGSKRFVVHIRAVVNICP